MDDRSICGEPKRLPLIHELDAEPIQANLAASNPVSAFWDHSLTDEASSNVYFYPAFLMAMCALDLVLDFTILSLPLPVIHSLHMTTRRKWQVSGIFLLGFL